MRHDGREVEDLREITIEMNKYLYPAGSVEIHFGKTHVVCNATVEEKVPPFLRGQGQGFVTAEYSMLPFATQSRTARERKSGVKGRTQEIQRLIGRSLRQAVDLEKLGERTITIDCDVLQADGGTRTASITGGFIALALACRKLVTDGVLKENPVAQNVAAISVGILADGTAAVDLDYSEDSQAVVDMNLVMNDDGDFIEIQGTGEKSPFSGSELNTLLNLGKNAIVDLIARQKEALLEELPTPGVREILVATGNAGKAAEFAEMFAPMGFTIKTLLDYPNLPEVEETGTTFAENARLKAETIAKLTQQPVIADDSGLTVAALDGLPGIFSARYAGPQKNPASNNAKLLASLAGVPAANRQAAFHCALAVAAPNAETLVVEAQWPGLIATIPSGTAGFGYDPLFYLPELNKTAAELTAAEKNKLSHRAQALALLKAQWPAWWEGVTQ